MCQAVRRFPLKRLKTQSVRRLMHSQEIFYAISQMMKQKSRQITLPRHIIYGSSFPYSLNRVKIKLFIFTD